MRGQTPTMPVIFSVCAYSLSRSTILVDGDGKTIGKVGMNNAIAAMDRPERDKGTLRSK